MLPAVAWPGSLSSIAAHAQRLSGRWRLWASPPPEAGLPARWPVEGLDHTDAGRVRWVGGCLFHRQWYLGGKSHSLGESCLTYVCGDERISIFQLCVCVCGAGGRGEGSKFFKFADDIKLGK